MRFRSCLAWLCLSLALAAGTPGNLRYGAIPAGSGSRPVRVACFHGRPAAFERGPDAVLGPPVPTGREQQEGGGEGKGTDVHGIPVPLGCATSAGMLNKT